MDVSTTDPAPLPETPDLQGAYPRLSHEQLQALSAHGERRATRPGQVLYRALPLAVLVLDRLLKDTGAMAPGPLEAGVDIVHPHLDHVGDDARLRRLPLAPHIGNDHRPVGADPHLRPMRLPDADALGEAERLSEPGHRSPDIGVDEHRDHRRRRNGSIGQHRAAT